MGEFSRTHFDFDHHFLTMRKRKKERYLLRWVDSIYHLYKVVEDNIEPTYIFVTKEGKLKSLMD